MIRRYTRQPAPALPVDGPVELEEPPTVPAVGTTSWTRVLMFLPMMAGGGAMAMMWSNGRGGALGWLAGGLFGLSMLGMIAVQFAHGTGGRGKRELMEVRRGYMRRLSRTREQVRAIVREQRAAYHHAHPPPDSLWSTAASARLWERRPTDADFAVVRFGIGSYPLHTELRMPPLRHWDELETVCAQALVGFERAYRSVDELPKLLPLLTQAHLFVDGPPDRVRALVRAMLAQLAVFHAPDDLLIAVCAADEHREWWQWAKWLPHAFHPRKRDRAGPVRLITPSLHLLEALLDDLLPTRPRFDPNTVRPGGPHLVVVVDGADDLGADHLTTAGGLAGVTVVHLLVTPPRVLDEGGFALTVDDGGRIAGRELDNAGELGVADSLSLVEMEALARQLAPLRLSADAQEGEPMARDMGLTELLELGDPRAFDPAHTWRRRSSRDRLRVPLGVGGQGRRIELDLKESALKGMGPHGLLIGDHGSGKSEMLRTLVLSLAVTHDPETLNFVLVDFKGGLTFAKLDRLPHTSAVITNLRDARPLVDRMKDVLEGELLRRQELLKQFAFDSQHEYERARLLGARLEPLPSLLVICDEFKELLQARPDFLDMFLQIARIGRALGVHLLLASQRLDEGRLRGLDTFLDYRIALRTNSSMESRAVLGVDDAYRLPRGVPGLGYLKVGTDELVRFRSAYVSALTGAGATGLAGGATAPGDLVVGYGTDYQAPSVADDSADDDGDDPWGTRHLQPVGDRGAVRDRALSDGSVAAGDDLPAEAAGDGAETLLDILVGRLADQGTPAQRIWLPPLGVPPTLDQLLPRLIVDPDRGLTTSAGSTWGALTAVVGHVDRPRERTQDPLRIDLSGDAGNGNLAIVGGQRSGRSTLVRSVIASLALCHTPAEAQFYCLDFSDGTLTTLADLPHVGGVASRGDPDRVRRTVAEVRAVLLDRERRFVGRRVGFGAYRQMRRDGEITDDPFGDVFLVVDGWATLRTEFADLEPVVAEFAGRGLGYGIHLIVTASRWMDLRQQDMFGEKLELRLDGAADTLNRRASFNIPERSPGRGITPAGLHFHGALPRIDGDRDPATLDAGVAMLVEAIGHYSTRPPAPRVRMLPQVLPYVDPPAVAVPAHRSRLPVGMAESDLREVTLDIDADPHCLLFGDVESGKTAFLRALARSIMCRYPPDEAQIITVGRGLRGVVPDEYLCEGEGHAATAQDLTDLMVGVVEVMSRRSKAIQRAPVGGAGGAGQRRPPRMFVLVDDYERISMAMANPLAALIPYLPDGQEIGLHVVVARAARGAGRALLDHVISALRNCGSPAILLSCPAEEGPLFEVRPRRLPRGRGLLVDRRGTSELVQLSWLPEPGSPVGRQPSGQPPTTPPEDT
ncbi:type VII secretion protein EccCa/type VII secretion protein EccCb [Frankia sp. QA3]|nr:type VII secretion protein EccCa/type VII secretion protein EccCb [Frankia sp. QA3]